MQGPFAPRALPRFIATTDPSDSLASHPDSYAFLPGRRGTTPTDEDLSYSQVNLSMRAAPSNPGEPVGCSYLLLHRPFKASSNPEDWPLPLV